MGGCDLAGSFMAFSEWVGTSRRMWLGDALLAQTANCLEQFRAAREQRLLRRWCCHRGLFFVFACVFAQTIPTTRLALNRLDSPAQQIT